MSEQIPINTAATEQRLVEELTGHSAPLEQPEAADVTEPGDPEPIDDPDHAFTD